MSTVQVTPTPESSALRTYEQELIASLSSHHASVSYAVLAILAVVIILAGIGGWLALKSYDAAIARADAQNALYQQDRKDFMAQLKENNAARDAIMAQQNATIANMARRQQVAQTQVAEVNKITTQPEAVGALNKAYHIVFDPSSVPQLNLFTVTKIEHDQLQGDLNDEKALFNGERQKTASLTADLGKSQVTLDACNKTVDDYKKAAKKSKFQKFLTGAGYVLAGVAGVWIGKKF